MSDQLPDAQIVANKPVFPEMWPDAGDELMSNFDGEVNLTIEQRLRNGKLTASYPGWNFYATCWFQDGQFHARVKRYRVVVGIYSADTPSGLRHAVSADYGYE